jgi:hypothetical protein
LQACYLGTTVLGSIHTHATAVLPAVRDWQMYRKQLAGKLLPIGGVMRMHMHLRGIMGTCMLLTALQHISKSACLIYLFKEIDTFCSRVFDIIFWIFLEDRTTILFNQMI